MSYFEKDCLDIAGAARANLGVFFDVGCLVLLSIRQPWQGMPAQLRDVKAKGRDSAYLFGFKRDGFDYLTAQAPRLQAIANATHASGDLDAAIRAYLEIPGLGIVKASFLAQMTIGQGACLDTHNLVRLGLPETAFRTPKTLSGAAIDKRIAAYNATWQAVGDSAFWWNSWCDYLATRTRNAFESGDAVSKTHRLPLILNQLEAA